MDGSHSPEPLAPRTATARRATDLQEKNRKAQRRFRERQKAKVGELEETVAQLSARIADLTSEKGSLDNRVGILARVLRMREEHIETLQRRTQPTMDNAEDMQQMDDLQLTSQTGQAISFTSTQIKEMPSAHAIVVWKGYVNLMAVLLVDADSGEATPANSSTLNRLVKELCEFVMKMHLLNPVTTRQLTACKLEDSADNLGEAESTERWLTLSRSLGLSQQQRQEIVQLRRLFITKMENIIRQRKEIHDAQLHVPVAPSFSRAIAAQSLHSHDAIEQLRASLKEEHLLKMDWALTLFKHTLLPVQVARALVQAWPWAPDTLAVATWVAAEENEADALAMLSQITRSQPLIAPSGSSGLGANGPLLAGPPAAEALGHLNSTVTSLLGGAISLGSLSSLPSSSASPMLHSAPVSQSGPLGLGGTSSSAQQLPSQVMPPSTLPELGKLGPIERSGPVPPFSLMAPAFDNWEPHMGGFHSEDFPGSSGGLSSSLRNCEATGLPPPISSFSCGQLGGGSSVNVPRPLFDNLETGQTLLLQPPLLPFKDQEQMDLSLPTQKQSLQQLSQPEQPT